MVKQNIFFKSIVCLLIWGLLSANTAFAFQASSNLKKDYLSPRINLSKESFKKTISIFLRMQVEDALQATVANINEIGRRNFKRELNPKELVVALSMIFGRHSLQDIDKHFRSTKKLKQKTMEALSGFIGWSLGFFYWKEKNIDLRNKYIFADPVDDLSKNQKKQFQEDIKQVMLNIINERFNPEDNPPKYNPGQTENLSLIINQVIVDDVGAIVLEINFSGLLLSSI